MFVIIEANDGLPRNRIKLRLRLPPPQFHQYGHLPSLPQQTRIIKENYLGIEDAHKDKDLERWELTETEEFIA